MSSPSPTTLGERVRFLREKKGMSQSELAGALPGVKQQSIDQLEQGQVRRPRFLPELAVALGTNVQWLLTGEENAPAPDTEIDTALLRDVFVAVENVLAQKKLHLDTAHKANIVGALYELMQDETQRGPEALNQAAANVVDYDQLMRRNQR